MEYGSTCLDTWSITKWVYMPFLVIVPLTISDLFINKVVPFNKLHLKKVIIYNH